MARYRYSPRDFLVHPALFGRRLDAAWKPGPAGQDAVYAASYVQHVAACLTVAAGQDRGEDLETMAGRLDVSADTLRRKLYGESPARLDEILGWALTYGIEILPELSDPDQLFPKTTG